MGRIPTARQAAKEAAKEGEGAAQDDLLALPALPPRRKGGTAKWKKGSKVLVPHTDQVSGRRQVMRAGRAMPDGWGKVHWQLRVGPPPRPPHRWGGHPPSTDRVPLAPHPIPLCPCCSTTRLWCCRARSGRTGSGT